MDVARRKSSPERLRKLNADIAEVIDCRGVSGRVCSQSCMVVCPQCGSRGCQCACWPGCPHAARTLSVDPDLHPIEPAIVPLVFEMKRLGFFESCWSCEGHAAPDGSIWKSPSLWFYSRSQTHLRLLANGLAALHFAGRLSTPWRVFITFSDNDNPDATFALEPVLTAKDRPSLQAVQADLGEIARSLQSMLAQEAQRLRRDLLSS